MPTLEILGALYVAALPAVLVTAFRPRRIKQYPLLQWVVAGMVIVSVVIAVVTFFATKP